MEHIVFQYFEEISAIPRGSRNCQEISDYLVSFAKDRNLFYIQDDAKNVIIKKPGSAGFEDAPAVILQGHMDMICEKIEGSTHDFLKDGLTLEIKDDYLSAKDTTLGGDDGIAIAYALAILADDTLVHPPLEVVITTDEEIGLLGATALDASSLEAAYMINIDSEDEDIILASCAGGLRADCRLPLTYEKQEGRRLTITVKGLLGGHSGGDIDKGRLNANLLLARLMFDLGTFSFSVSEMKGGLMDNAIPREAVAHIVTSEEEAYKIINEVKFLNEKYRSECRTNEPDLTITISQGEEKTYSVMTKESYQKLLFFLLEAPNGILTMSPDIEGLVESSLNLGIFTTNETEARMAYAVRSSLSSYKAFIRNKLEYFITYLGGTFSTSGEYPGWEFKKDSKLRTIYAEAYQKVTGNEIRVEAIHAGLECGILSEKIGNLDIISVGPQMHDIHTTEERLSISSTLRVYETLLWTLRALAAR
ncbi:MAG: dipeptidase [Clostridiales bacterium]|nr:dipeptidase [Clostridiales bacterium]